MDYLPIQASAVACERVFSSSAETDTKKRNRIKPELMEALQILKYALKKDRLNFTAHLRFPEDEPPSTAVAAEPTDMLTEILNMKRDTLEAFLETADFDE
jgi:hypothetical protein